MEALFLKKVLAAITILLLVVALGFSVFLQLRQRIIQLPTRKTRLNLLRKRMIHTKTTALKTMHN